MSFICMNRIGQEDCCRKCHSLAQHIRAHILLASLACVLHLTLTKIFEKLSQSTGNALKRKEMQIKIFTPLTNFAHSAKFEGRSAMKF